jgi:hypothetical protein
MPAIDDPQDSSVCVDQSIRFPLDYSSLRCCSYLHRFQSHVHIQGDADIGHGIPSRISENPKPGVYPIGNQSHRLDYIELALSHLDGQLQVLHTSNIE